MAKTETAPAPQDPRQERLNDLKNLALTAYRQLRILGVAENAARVAAGRLHDFTSRQVEDEIARQLVAASEQARLAFAHISAAQAQLDLALRAEAEPADRRAK